MLYIYCHCVVCCTSPTLFHLSLDSCQKEIKLALIVRFGKLSGVVFPAKHLALMSLFWLDRPMRNYFTKCPTQDIAYTHCFPQKEMLKYSIPSGTADTVMHYHTLYSLSSKTVSLIDVCLPTFECFLCTYFTMCVSL